MGLYSEGLIIGGIFFFLRFRLGGLIHGGAYVQNFTVVKLANIV